MPISLERLQRDLETIARSTHTPGRGADRPTFSVPWSGAVGYVIHEATSCGCCARRDAAGNVHIKPSALVQPEADATNSKRKRGNGDAASPASPLWLSGSHLDSVPAGGDFDGVVGVIVPLEVLRAAREDGREAPLELVIFADEEGTTFGLGMIGSRAWTGQLDVTHLAELRNARGENYLQAGAPYGVTANRLAADRFEPADYRGMIEVHMPLRFWNKNYVGTHFGGSLYTMCDPFFMLILVNNLGSGYIVWDKAATIRFKKPGIFYMELYPPHASRLRLQGNVLTIRLPKEGVTDRLTLPQEESLERWFAYLARPITVLPEGVDVRAEHRGGLWTLRISPGEKGGVQSLQLVFDGEGGIKRLAIDEKNGDRTVIRFHDFRRNVGLGEHDFQVE